MNDPAIADEAIADEARQRLRDQGIVPIVPDGCIAGMLDADEILVAVRRSVSLERRKEWRGMGPGLDGDLYLTTRRLVHLGRVPIAYPLCEIREAVVATDALLLVVGGNHGVAIEVRDPRLLRVEIAAARAASHAAAALETGFEAAVDLPVGDPRGGEGGQPSSW